MWVESTSRVASAWTDREDGARGLTMEVKKLVDSSKTASF